MPTPESIERMLEQRLIPRGFTDHGSAALDALIDDLAASDPPAARHRRWIAGSAAAAAAVVAACAGWWAMPGQEPPAMAETAVADQRAERLELLSESVGVVTAVADDLLRSDDEGNLLRAWHLEVVSEERFLDVETGHEVRIVSPSDELVLVPVSTF